MNLSSGSKDIAKCLSYGYDICYSQQQKTKVI